MAQGTALRTWCDAKVGRPSAEQIMDAVGQDPIAFRIISAGYQVFALDLHEQMREISDAPLPDAEDPRRLNAEMKRRDQMIKSREALAQRVAPVVERLSVDTNHDNGSFDSRQAHDLAAQASALLSRVQARDANAKRCPTCKQIAPLSPVLIEEATRDAEEIPEASFTLDTDNENR